MFISRFLEVSCSMNVSRLGVSTNLEEHRKLDATCNFVDTFVVFECLQIFHLANEITQLLIKPERKVLQVELGFESIRYERYGRHLRGIKSDAQIA